jgi:vitamin K-dependent gamma-carboxylase
VHAQVRRWTEALDRPVDGASLAFFRAALGISLVVLAARFFTHHWIDADYVRPQHFFTYWGFGWVRPWPGIGMYIHYAVMLAAAACIALGVFYRLATVIFALTFNYAHLCDKANYLNHYYLLGLVSILLVLLPLDREGSLRVWLRPEERAPRVRRWMLLYGGIAKMGGDWLLRGEPLRIWLAANVELPLLGRYFAYPGVALAMSWGGMLFDLTIVPLLLFRRTRVPAYVVLLVFHGLTSLLFRIGMFPWVMSVGATLFFDPAWPRAASRRMKLLTLATPSNSAVAGAKVSVGGTTLFGLYAVVQLLMPLRHFLYPGNTLWTEEGFRYSWRVMLVEKAGDVELTVVDVHGDHHRVAPRDYLTPYQARMASTQPDMIIELAQMVARDFDRRGLGPVKVFADAWVSFNGRPHARLLDPAVDLTQVGAGLWPDPAIMREAPSAEAGR